MAEPLTFTRSSQWVETSSCGRYTVAAAKVDGAFVFQAWHGRIADAH